MAIVFNAGNGTRLSSTRWASALALSPSPSPIRGILTQHSLKGEPSQKQVRRRGMKRSLQAGDSACPNSQQSILVYYLGFVVRLGTEKKFRYKGNSSDRSPHHTGSLLAATGDFPYISISRRTVLEFGGAELVPAAPWSRLR